MFHISDLTKIKIANFLSAALFWMAIVVLYFQSRNFSLEQVFRLISFYAISIVILEYPTGVVGDYFSHKLSVFWGTFILAISLFLAALPGSYIYYVFVLLLMALSQALVSGSDTALLYTISKNFKKDLADIKTLSIISTVVATSVGGLVAKHNLSWPLYLTSFANFIAVFFILSIKVDPVEKGSGNIFSKAIEGLKFVKQKRDVLILMNIAGLTGAFFISFKWLYNSLFAVLAIDISLWGILISVAILMIALGTKLYNKCPKIPINFSLGLLILTIVVTGVTKIPILSLAGLFLHHIVQGFFGTQLEVELNDKIGSSVRASVLSLKNLLVRLESSIYVFIVGLVLERSPFFMLMFLTAIFIAIVSFTLLSWFKRASNYDTR